MYERPKDKSNQKADVFSEKCPARFLLDKISGKWSILVIDALNDKKLRNGELLRKIQGVSQKMLTQTLRELEAIKIVVRHDMQTVPPHVEYELTALGKSLRENICALDRWIEENMFEIVSTSK